MKRRIFIHKLALSLSAIAGLIAGISFLRQFYPPSFVRKKKIKIGDPNLYPVDTYTYLDKYDLYIYRDYESVRAVSAVCTHLGCILEKTTEGFECPCHGSKYNDRGEVLSGPAPTDLKWYMLQKANDGRLVVDMSRIVDAEYRYSIG